MKFKYYKIIYPVIALIAVLSIMFVINNSVNASNVQRIEVQVVGESIIGEQYSKELILTKENRKFFLDFSRVSKDESKFGKNINIKKEITSEVFENFLKILKDTKDQGESALCCDHPFTLIKIVKTSNKTINKTVAMQPIDIEGFFGITD